MWNPNWCGTEQAWKQNGRTKINIRTGERCDQKRSVQTPPKELGFLQDYVTKQQGCVDSVAVLSWTNKRTSMSPVSEAHSKTCLVVMCRCRWSVTRNANLSAVILFASIKKYWPESSESTLSQICEKITQLLSVDLNLHITVMFHIFIQRTKLVIFMLN